MMKKEQKYFDFNLILFILGMFILASFFATQIKENAIENLVMLVALFVTIIIGYFFGIVATITSSAVIIFSYGSFILYFAIILGNPVGVRVYFWTILVVYFSVIISMLHNFVENTEKEIEELKFGVDNYVTIDYITKMDNSKAFCNSLNQYMSIAKRHNVPLVLMIIKIQHFKEIEKITGSTKMLDVIKIVGESIEEVTREEDRCFILDNRDVFGLVMFTDSKGADVVKKRLKEHINTVNINLIKKDITVNIDLKVGYAQYDNEEIDIIKFKMLAEKELEYDI